MTELLAGPVTERADGPAGNERLTAWTGAVLFVLLAVEGVTILALGSLAVPHIVLGVVLIGPVALKIGSTLYRFARYYGGAEDYRQAGPPTPVLRVLGPVMVVATAAVLATGVALLYVPATDLDAVYTLHKISFIVWFMATAVHVLAYVWRVPRLIGSDLGTRARELGPRRPGLRIAAVLASLAFGVALAAATYSQSSPWAHGSFLGG